MGFLNVADWKATWIKAGYDEDTLLRPSPLFRKNFTAAKKIQSATLFITSHGLYESFINGKRISDDYLTPGFTSFNKRLQYQLYDVTKYLQQGKNAISVALYSDMKPTGTFTTSNAMLNQLQHNIQWGQKGNFVDIPTDCPILLRPEHKLLCCFLQLIVRSFYLWFRLKLIVISMFAI